MGCINSLQKTEDAECSESPPTGDNNHGEKSSDSPHQSGPVLHNVKELFKKTSSLMITAGWDVWDDVHVRLPASKRCVYPKKEDSGETGTPSKKDRKFISKWQLIKEAFSDPIKTSYELEDAIISYNHLARNKNYDALHHFFNNVLPGNETKHFFNEILPKIVELALSIPDLFNMPIPLLRTGHPGSLTLSQRQIACLLANAFLCTFSRQPEEYPSINFTSIFSRPRSQHDSLKIKCEKLKFITHYFRRVTSEMDSRPDGFVTFARHCLAQKVEWSQIDKKLTSCKIFVDGSIETDGVGMLQMDFANMYIGGGVLDGGCVQEEIRFLICPELIVSRLFVQRMDDPESVLIVGCEQFSKYSGYGGTLQWDGDFVDQTPRDSLGKIDTRIVAADATPFYSRRTQFQPEFVRRELAKAVAAFYPSSFSTSDRPSAVATGNWGCGAFGGDPKLKFLVQLLAASFAGRDLVYFTFGDIQLKSDLDDMFEFLNVKLNLSVREIYDLLMSYYSNVILVSSRNSGIDLYNFIYQQFSKK